MGWWSAYCYSPLLTSLLVSAPFAVVGTAQHYAPKVKLRRNVEWTPKHWFEPGPTSPVEGARVSAPAAGRPAPTDADGRFALWLDQHPLPRSAVLQASFEGTLLASATADLAKTAAYRTQSLDEIKTLVHTDLQSAATRVRELEPDVPEVRALYCEEARLLIGKRPSTQLARELDHSVSPEACRTTWAALSDELARQGLDAAVRGDVEETKSAMAGLDQLPAFEQSTPRQDTAAALARTASKNEGRSQRSSPAHAGKGAAAAMLRCAEAAAKEDPRDVLEALWQVGAVDQTGGTSAPVEECRKRVEARVAPKAAAIERRCSASARRIAGAMRPLTSVAYAEQVGRAIRSTRDKLQNKMTRMVVSGGPSYEDQEWVQCVVSALSDADDFYRGVYRMNRGDAFDSNGWVAETLAQGRFDSGSEGVLYGMSHPGTECASFVRSGMSGVLGPVDTYLAAIAARPDDCR